MNLLQFLIQIGLRDLMTSKLLVRSKNEKIIIFVTRQRVGAQHSGH